ncbi:hypothetical protein KC887_06225 [Candidatus Kaiserbacteria bacterium]|nr:hypothetical protein [Candidatus Kaiserbacteria bacterium]
MKRFSEQLQKKAASVKLSASERKQLREQVCSYMEYHPLPASMQTAKQTKVAAPVTDSFTMVRVAWKELFQASAIFAGFALILIPFFAEQAVPGDTLYAVKVGFNEEIRSSLTWDPYQKVEWETTRLNRRLAEARLLADEGKLTEDVEAEVAAAVKEHSDNAKQEIAAIGATDAEGAAIASIEFDTAVTVQADALAAKQASGTVAIAAALAAAVAPSDMATSTIPAYDKLMGRIETNTTRVYELLEQLKGENKPENQAEITDVTRRFEDIERTIEDAVALHDTDDVAARVMLVDVLKRTQRLTVFMTDIAVRQSVSVEDVVPVVLTKDEQAVLVAELGNDIDANVAEITTAIPQIADSAVTEKLNQSLIDIASLQDAAEQAAFKQQKQLLEEAVALSDDAVGLVRQYVDVTKTVATPRATSTPDVATSTPPVATSTSEAATTTTPESEEIE